MGFWRTLARRLGLPARQFAAQGQVPDEAAPRPIDQVILEMSGRGSAPRVSRVEALSVPTMLRARNMICSVATLPLVQTNAKFERVDNPLLRQIDPDVANVVTLAQTLEDLLCDAVSWWRITAFGWDGYPAQARHIEVGSVSLEPPAGRALAPLPSGLDPREAVVWVDGEPVPGSEMIRFDSPNPAVLKYAGRALRRAALLAASGAMYADDPRPLGYFTPLEGADPASDEEIAEILATWKAARKERATGYVPAALKYNSVDAMSPADLQLAELDKQAGLAIANATGIDPEDLGISTTSRTYQNDVDRRRTRVNDVLAPYMLAISQRLTMGDVTKRGNRVDFDLDDYLKSNPTERWSTYKTAKDIGVLSPQEIRERERIPGQAPKADPPPVAPPVTPPGAGQPTDEETEVDADRPPMHVFSGEQRETRTFDLPVVQFNVNKTSRIIEGLALPYGQVVRKYGIGFRFLPGSLKWNKGAVSRIKLLRDHDMRQPIGVAERLVDGPSGLASRFKVARGAAGDEALSLAEDKVLDGLSVGVDFDLVTDTIYNETEDVYDVKRADLQEITLTAMPAFDDARLTKVAASKTGGTMLCSHCGHEHAEGVACPTTTTPANPVPQVNPQLAGLTLSQDQIAALLAHPGALQSLIRPPQASTAPAAPAGGLTLSKEQLDAIIASGGLGVLLGVPQLTPAPGTTPPGEQRQTVNPTRNPTAVTATKEALPYRFDREGNLTKGATFDFSTDLIAGSKGDGDALKRAQTFLEAMAPHFTRAQFDVDKADAAALNPNINRPDMYVDQKDFNYPIWDAISKGTLADSTPFVLPKFSSATGLVAAHVEGVEPTPGTFVATAQTITPSAVSGKVEITREAWDQGGNPQLSGIIWRQMTKAWFEALEASAVALLDGLTPTGITLTTAAQDDVLVGEFEAALASLQFIRGGFRMRDLFLQIDLYKALINAVDADGRKLLPRIGPVNANGQVSDFFADLDIAGLRGRPGWALAASGTVAASSYLFDRNDVHGWATAPQRLEFQYRVAYVDVAIWGYKATANTDLTGVREVIYDPA